MRLTLILFVTVAFIGCKSIDAQNGDFRSRWSDLDRSVDVRADVEAEIKFGREVAARLLGQYKGVENLALQQYVNTLGQYLVQYSGRDDINFHFWVIESDDVNAYAAPGGYVFVTTAAIKAMTNEAQLAGVLAHEIAHIREKHLVKSLDIKAVGAGASFVQLTSGANDAFRVAFTQAADAALDILTDTGLQQEDEFSADEVGLLIMVQAGYEPQQYLTFLEYLQTSSAASVRQLDSTHPPFSKRTARLVEIQQDYGLENLNYAVMEERFSQFQL